MGAINVDAHRLSILPSFCFSTAWGSLSIIRVRNNDLESVAPLLFRKMNSVTEFNFEQNRLSTLDLTRHNSIATVRKFLVGRNVLTEITGLEDFKDLTEVDLSHNRLTDVSGIVTKIL